MPDRVREIVLNAITAAKYGAPLEPSLVQAVSTDNLEIERLCLDSLGWMEFCISVELQCGEELTPAEIEKMHYLGQIEDWLRERKI